MSGGAGLSPSTVPLIRMLVFEPAGEDAEKNTSALSP